jgi:Fe-S cluster assembly iron-binding protein IscA
LALDEPTENETAIKVNGIEVLIADPIRTIANKNKVDYVTSPRGEGFVIGNCDSCC